MKRTFLLLLLPMLLTACGLIGKSDPDSTVAHTPLPPTSVAEGTSSGSPVPRKVLDGLEFEIARSTVIARAKLDFVSWDVDAYYDNPYIDDMYRQILKYRLTVHEYLKGAGPSCIEVLRGAYGWHKDRRVVENRVKRELEARYSRFDDREAIVFLGAWFEGPRQYFSLSAITYYDDDEYSLLSPRHRRWLPATRTDGGTEYLLALPPDFPPLSEADRVAALAVITDGMGSIAGDYVLPEPLEPTASSWVRDTISLAELKTLISTIDAEIAALSGPVDLYWNSVIEKYREIGFERAESRDQ